MPHNIAAGPRPQAVATEHLFGVSLPLMIVDWERLSKHRNRGGSGDRAEPGAARITQGTSLT
jgi:hypothetical protein